MAITLTGINQSYYIAYRFERDVHGYLFTLQFCFENHLYLILPL